MVRPVHPLYSVDVEHDGWPVHPTGAVAREQEGEPTVNATKGMNVEEVRRMSGQLREAADEITRIEQELTSGLEGVDWTGPDADRFRGQWSGEMVPALQQIMNSVHELGETADRNAAEQEAASTS